MLLYLLLGIMPYISASIVVQLMGIAIPYLQKLQKEGESGRKKINQITRWLTILICFVQAPAYLCKFWCFGVPQAHLSWGKVWALSFICNYSCNRLYFCNVVGEKITDKGIGNGISLLIMVGIIASLPQVIFQELHSSDSLMVV